MKAVIGLLAVIFIAPILRADNTITLNIQETNFIQSSNVQTAFIIFDGGFEWDTPKHILVVDWSFSSPLEGLESNLILGGLTDGPGCAFTVGSPYACVLPSDTLVGPDIVNFLLNGDFGSVQLAVGTGAPTTITDFTFAENTLLASEPSGLWLLLAGLVPLGIFLKRRPIQIRSS